MIAPSDPSSIQPRRRSAAPRSARSPQPEKKATTSAQTAGGATPAPTMHRYHVDLWKVRGVDHPASVDGDDTAPLPQAQD